MKNAWIVINSLIAFITASLVETTLHECGHFLAATVFGADATLYHNYVKYGTFPTTQAHIISAMAGPFMSLLIGIVCHSIISLRVANGIGKLTLLYLSLFGYTGFFCYIAIAPFFSYGDTGYVLMAIRCPFSGIVVLAVFSVISMFMISKALVVHFISLMSSQTVQQYNTREQFIRRLILYPLIIGIALTTLLNFPASTFLSLIAPIFSPLVLLWPYYYYLTQNAEGNDEQETISKKASTIWIVIVIILIAINRVLVLGV